MRIGLICGMAAEAAALGKLRNHARLRVAVSGARPDVAEAMARQMLDDGVDALLSWGIAGALSPDLPSGALLIPTSVVDPASGMLPLAGIPDSGGNGARTLAGSEVVVTTPSDKSALRASTSADAVDMETHRVARVAVQAGVPCFAIRAVSDPADRALPAGTEDALDMQGRPRIVPVLIGLARHPGRLGALLAAKRDLDTALATLSVLGVELLRGVLDAPSISPDSDVPL